MRRVFEMKETRAAEMKPGFAAAHNEIGKIHLKKGDSSADVNTFVEAIGIEPGTEYVKNLQAALAKQTAEAASPVSR